jgi:hypothetical protein
MGAGHFAANPFIVFPCHSKGILMRFKEKMTEPG